MYGVYCTDFLETQNFSMELCEDLGYRNLPTSDSNHAIHS